MLNRKQRAHRSQTTGLGRIGRVLLSVCVGVSVTLLGIQPSQATNTVTVILPIQKLIVGNNSNVGITGVSVTDNTVGTTSLLVNITLKNVGSSGDYLSIDTSTITGITPAYPYTGANFTNFTTISFTATASTGTMTNLNTILSSSRFKFNKGSTTLGLGTIPTISIAATETPANSTVAYNATTGHYYQFFSYTTSLTINATCTYTQWASSSSCIKDKTQSEAYSYAAAQTFAGKPGYLVAITSADENIFVQNQIGSSVNNVWIGASDRTTTGGEGIWQWMGTNAPEFKLAFGHVSVANPACTITFRDSNHGYVNSISDYFASSDTCGGADSTASYVPTSCTNDTATSAAGASSQGYSNWCDSEPNNADGATGENSAVTNWNGGTKNGSSCWNDLRDGNTGSVSGFVVEYGDLNSPGNFTGATNSASAKVFLNSVFSISSLNNQSATVDTQVAIAPQVRLLDEAGNVVTGSPTVTWAVTGGGGTLGATSSNIDSSTGYATPTSWTMGTNKGTDTITATLSDTATPTVLTFVATAVGAKQSAVTMSGGSTTAGLTYALSASGGSTATAFVFTTSSAGCSISGSTLTISFSSSSGSCLITATRPGGTHYLDETTTATITYASSVRALAYPSVLNTIAGNVVYQDPSPAATGGTGAITYSISPSPGNVTNRITINASTGRVTVNSNAQSSDAGTYTITATDSLGDTFTTTLPITFLPGCSFSFSTTGGVTVETITSGSNCGIALPNQSVHFLVVGGGGQGGAGRGGGGGAGGLVYNKFTPQAGSVYSVTIGLGGQANSGTRGNNGNESQVTLNGTNVIVAGGGGGGGGMSTDTLTVANGVNANSPSAATFSAQGSGGGGATNFWNNVVNVYTTGGTGFTAGGNSYRCTTTPQTNDHMRTNGGGGGAGSAGSGGGTNCATQNLSNVAAPNGGVGIAYSISGASQYYAAGGGGSDGRADALSECQQYYSTLKGVGGSGVGGTGAQFCNVFDTSTPTNNGYTPEIAPVANTGSGGGATLRAYTTSGYAGYGATGIAIFRFINQAPVITGVNCDTTTALFSNNTLTTTATRPETLTATMDTSTITLLNRVYQWQYRTSSASNTWVNTGYNSLVETFTAGTGGFLNGAQIRLMVTDSDTVDTSTDTLALTSYSSIITLVVDTATSFTTAKQNVSYTYGSGISTALTRTVQYGTGPFVINTAYSATPNTGALIQDATTVAGTLYETVTSRAFNYGTTGIIYETITVTDAVGYVFVETMTITVTKAGALTFQADTLTALTYRLDSVTVTATTSTTGLVSGDTYTVGTYLFQKYTTPTCAQGGPCSVGDVGPAGGIIFADLGGSPEVSASSVSSGGRYLEAAPAGSSGFPSGISTTAVWCSGSAGAFSQNGLVGNGYGAYSTNVVVYGTNGCTGGAVYNAATYSVNGYSDWFLPSQSEINTMMTSATKIGMSSGSHYWSSSNWSSDTTQAFFVTAPTQSATTEAISTSNKYWPVRAFNALYLSQTLTGVPTSTPPTTAGTYQITIDSTTVSFQSGVIGNYTSTSYLAGQVVINKATHKYLLANESMTALNWEYNKPISLRAFSDPGETTTAAFVVTPLAGTTCNLNPSSDSVTATLTATSTNGITAVCYLRLSRVATANFNAITGDTITVTFSAFVLNSATPYFAGGGNMAIGIGGPIVNIPPVTGDTTTVTAATITSVYDNTTASSSVFHAGDSLTLTGINLNGVTQIKYLGGGTTQTFAANSSQTSLTFTLPGDVATGPVLVQKPSPDGIGFKTGRFNITIS